MLATGRARYSDEMRSSLAIAVLALLGCACGPTIGDPCTTAADCNNAVCVSTKDWAPGGYCTSTCKTDDPNSCPSGTICVRDALGRNAPGCFRLCDKQSECRNGYTCRSENSSPNICVGAIGF